MNVAVTTLLLVFAFPAATAAPEPRVVSGAPYVPSPHSIVDEMLSLAGVGPDDYLIDLGSGDGRIVLAAARRFGARGLGVEIQEDLVAQSREAAALQGIADRVRFVRQDLFETDLEGATVVTIYLLPETVNRLRDKLLWELRPGTRVLSHDYPIENWRAERVVELDHPDKVDVTGVTRTRLYLYRVPADVGGRWTAAVPAEIHPEPLVIEFAQVLTMLRGRTRIGERLVALDDLVLSGRELSFLFPHRPGVRFTGTVDEDVIEGRVHGPATSGTWRATRDGGP